MAGRKKKDSTLPIFPVTEAERAEKKKKVLADYRLTKSNKAETDEVLSRARADAKANDEAFEVARDAFVAFHAEEETDPIHEES